MTLTEALAIPKGMDFVEYEKLLHDKQKWENQIRKASDAIDDEVASLDVLSGEVGSERYNKHLQAKQKAEVKREVAQANLEQIERRLR